MKQLKQLQINPEKVSESSTVFEPMTSAVPVRRSNHWAMKPCGSKAKCEFNLYTSEDEDETNYTR